MLHFRCRLLNKYKQICELRRNNESTVPCLLQDELKLNPFLRTSDPKLCAALGMQGATGLEVFIKLRQMKDVF